MKKSTVYDVERISNVSVSTVSRYLNRTSYVDKQKIIAIENAMAELDFIPKPGRANVKGKKDKLIGVTIPSFDNAFISSILNGLDPAVQNSPYRLIIKITNNDKNRERNAIREMLKHEISGLILMVSSLLETEVQDIVGDLPVLILAGIAEGAYPCLKVDNLFGGKIATDFLIKLGHRRIVHIHGSEVGTRDSSERIKGYKQSLQEAGIAFDNKLLLDGGYEVISSARAMQKLIDQKVSFTAVFAANDLSAYGAIQTLQKNGIQVPDLVSVIGFDDLHTSSVFVPKLTTIRQPLEEIGEIAVQYIQDLITNHKSEYRIPVVELIERDSCAPAPARDWVKAKRNANVQQQKY